MKLLNRLLVETQVLFAADQDNGETLAEVQNLGNPLGRVRGSSASSRVDEDSYLLLDVVERIGRVDGKANQNDVGVGVGQRAQAVIIFLAGGIPQGELDVLAIDLDVGDVVLKDGRDVDL